MNSDKSWESNYLDLNYGGAPDECTPCFIRGEIITLVKGECPKCKEGPDGYSLCEPCNETHHFLYRHCKAKEAA